MVRINKTKTIRTKFQVFRGASVKEIGGGGKSARQSGDRISAALAGANTEIAARLEVALDQALKSAVWQSREGSADIYDTGELLSSARISVSGGGVDIFYDAPYAALIHYGGYILPYGNTSAQKVYIPPRPWVQSVIAGGGPVPRFDFEKILRDAINSAY